MNDAIRHGGFHERLGLPVIILVIFLLVACTAVSIVSVNQYRYGVWDHAIMVPFVKEFVNAELYPGDYLFTVDRYYYTLFWKGIGLLARSSGADLPALFFACYASALFATFGAFFLLARALFGRWEIASLACCLLVFSKKSLGDVSTIESILLTRSVALPILLMSLYCCVRGRLIRASLLAGVGFLIHPLSAGYVAAMLFLALLRDIREGGVRRMLTACGVFLVSASPVLVWKALSSPPSFQLLTADPEWMRLLRLRSSPAIFPSAWPGREFIEAAFAALLFVALLGRELRGRNRRTIVSFSLAVAILCVLGTVCAEVLPVPAVFTLQPIRSFQYVIYFAVLVYAAFLFRLLDRGGPAFPLLAGAALSAALLYDAHAGEYAVAACAAVAVAVVLARSAFAGRVPQTALAPVLGAALLFAGAIGSPPARDFTIRSAQDPAWLDVQRWARSHTSRTDVFIVPPRMEGFRVESERSIYADWKDGTMMNFDPAFGREWGRRMNRLGVASRSSLENCPARLDAEDLMSIAREDLGSFDRVFVVEGAAAARNDLPLVYRNTRFGVWAIPRP